MKESSFTCAPTRWFGMRFGYRRVQKGEPAEPSPAKKKEPTREPAEDPGYAVGLIEIAHLKIKDYDFYDVESALIYQDRVLRLRETEAFLKTESQRPTSRRFIFAPTAPTRWR